jgi:hypothetical protein
LIECLAFGVRILPFEPPGLSYRCINSALNAKTQYSNHAHAPLTTAKLGRFSGQDVQPNIGCLIRLICIVITGGRSAD